MTFNPLDEVDIMESAGRIGYGGALGASLPNWATTTTSGSGTVKSNSDGAKLEAPGSGDEAKLQHLRTESRARRVIFQVVFGTPQDASFTDWDRAAVGNVSSGNIGSNGHLLDLTDMTFKASGSVSGTLPGLHQYETYVLQIDIDLGAGETHFILAGHEDTNSNTPYYETATLSNVDEHGTHGTLAIGRGSATNSHYLKVFAANHNFRTEP